MNIQEIQQGKMNTRVINEQKLTDCSLFIVDKCSKKSCLFRHNSKAKTAKICCPAWLANTCINPACKLFHPSKTVTNSPKQNKRKKVKQVVNTKKASNGSAQANNVQKQVKQKQAKRTSSNGAKLVQNESKISSGSIFGVKTLEELQVQRDSDALSPILSNQNQASHKRHLEDDCHISSKKFKTFAQPSLVVNSFASSSNIEEKELLEELGIDLSEIYVTSTDIVDEREIDALLEETF